MLKDISKIKKIRKFVTTPAYYPNGEPHIGHFYSNVIANYFSIRLKLPIISGIDCHGRKIREHAQKLLIKPRSLVIQNAIQFKKMLRFVNRNSIFTLTNDAKHVNFVLKS